MNLTYAFVNHGRWIASCGRRHCAGAERLEPRQPAMHCANCHWEGAVQWPPDADAIWAALAVRPVPQTRNWFPAGHELALRSGCPHGQSAAALIAETHEHMEI